MPASGPRPLTTAQALAHRLRALHRVALAVARPGGPALYAGLVHELAAALEAAVVFVALFADDSRTTLRTLAVELDGRVQPALGRGSPQAGADRRPPARAGLHA